MKTEPGFSADKDPRDLKERIPAVGPSPQAVGGATDLFATISPKDDGPRNDDLTPEPPKESVRSATPAAVPEAPAPLQPVVHGVVFKGNTSSENGSDALLNLLRNSPPPSKLAAEATPTSAPTTAQGPDGGFTQLLRALNYEETRPEPTNALGAVGADQPFKPPVPSDDATAATSVLPSGIPVATSAEPQSLTQMLRAMDASASDPTPHAAPAQQVSPSVVGAKVPGSDPPVQASEPGSFTQLFSTLETDSPSHAPPAAIPFRRPSPPAETLDSLKPQNPPALQAVEAPGSSFTQLFRALDSPISEHRQAGETSPPSTRYAAPPAPSEVSTHGTFTQLFSTLGEPPSESLPLDTPRTAVRPPTTMPPPPEAEAASSSPGSFTQLFRTLDEPAKPPSPPEPRPNSFPAPPRPAAAEVSRNLPAMDTPSPGQQQGGPPESNVGASQIFSTYRNPPEKARPEPVQARPGALGYGQGTQPPSSPPAPEAAGLTQLLHLLDQPSQGAQQTESAARQMPTAAPPPGSFTSAYAALDSEPKPHASPFGEKAPSPPQASFGPGPRHIPAPIPPSEPSSDSGPSEFTRILSASALREAGLRAGAPAGSPAALASPQAPAAQAAAMPFSGLPAIPMTPQVPYLPQVPQAQPSQPPHLAVPVLPAAPSIPQLKLPEAPAPAAPTNKMQQYQPLLLIIIIFLLVVILVTVIFLLKH